jgi:hypothetical protein
VKYKILTNIPNLPKFDEISKPVKTESSEYLVNNNLDFKKLRISARTKALACLPITDADKSNAYFPTEPTGFERHDILDKELVIQLAEHLGFKKPSARVQTLGPGKVTLLHLDDLELGYMFPVENNLEKIEFTQAEIDAFYKDPSTAGRVFIMLADSKPGQLMTFGDDILSSWKKGDVIYWDWQTTVHSTANLGFWDRPIIRFTGLITDKTRNLIN